MVKNILRIAIATTFLVGNSSQTHADILLAWNTFGNLGTETTEPSVSNDLNIATANLSLGAGVNGSANVNRFGGNNWFNIGNTAGSTLVEAIAGNDFIQFSVAPNSGFYFSATSIVFSWDRSTT